MSGEKYDIFAWRKIIYRVREIDFVKVEGSLISYNYE